MFNFRIVTCVNGTEIIDRNTVTPYSSLTPSQMAEYQEIAVQLYIMDRMKQKRKMENQRRQRKPLYMLLCLLGFI